MSTKSEVLKLLEENKGTYLSGEELAIKLGCSRQGNLESDENAP